MLKNDIYKTSPTENDFTRQVLIITNNTKWGLFIFFVHVSVTMSYRQFAVGLNEHKLKKKIKTCSTELHMLITCWYVILRQTYKLTHKVRVLDIIWSKHCLEHLRESKVNNSDLTVICIHKLLVRSLHCIFNMLTVMYKSMHRNEMTGVSIVNN